MLLAVAGLDKTALEQRTRMLASGDWSSLRWLSLLRSSSCLRSELKFRPDARFVCFADANAQVVPRGLTGNGVAV